MVDVSPHIHTPTDDSTPRVEDGLRRRRFLQVLGGSAAIAGLSACADDGTGAGPNARGLAAPTSADSAGGSTAGASSAAADSVDARSVNIVPQLTNVADLQLADAGDVHMTYAPLVPPPVTRTDQRIVEFAIDVVESHLEIDPTTGVSTMAWGFRIAGDGDDVPHVPGPVMRARVGDLCRITVTNLAGNTEAHNIDWHAITGQGGGAEATTVPPGQSATINARLLYPGVYMYHCAFGDVPMHISHGMYGMFIVDPEAPLPEVDHEWAIMQSEWYLGDADADGEAPFDPEALRREHPSHVVFNGRIGALTGDNALQMEVGDRSRIFFVNEGLNLTSSFHPIGSHWDVVYPEAATHPINRVIRGSQSTLVVAGGGTVVELVGYVPLTIVLVDHALSRTFYRGTIGQIVVSGEHNAIFSEGDEALPDAEQAEPAAAGAADGSTVTIPDGAWDPSNAATAYTPQAITVPVGTTVTWVNSDIMPHSVTSGPSDGTSARPDGRFDSGLFDPGVSWQYTFDEAGTFDYHCTPHPWMAGQVVVTG